MAKYNLSHLAKYPGLLKLLEELRFLAPILGSIQAINLFRDPNATHDDKVVGLGRIMGEIGGAALFAKVGSSWYYGTSWLGHAYRWYIRCH